VSRGRFEVRIRELIEGHDMLGTVIGAMLQARAALWNEFTRLHRAMLKVARADPVCRQLMSAPSVGALVAVTYRSAVDDPGRFAKSRTVGAYFELTPKKYQSGETDFDGGVIKVGDAMVRAALYEAAHIMLTRIPVLCLKALGDGGRQAARYEAGEGGAGPQAGDRAAPHVDGCH
jgi:transposase